MPCDDCNKKKRGVIVHDNWKAGATNTVQSGNVKVGRVNMSIGRQSSRYSPYGAPAGGAAGGALPDAKQKMECKSCNKRLMQAAKYCMECANKKGKCSMCGKKLLDTAGVGAPHASLKKK